LQRKLRTGAADGVVTSRHTPAVRVAATTHHIIHLLENSMSKGMDSKKSEKKKPAKTMKEKKAAKQEKKKNQ
jgi:hypothetical protein